GQQIAETAGAFDRPRPLTERCRPPHQPLDLVGGRPHSQLAERALVLIQCHRRVRCLVRVDPDHHSHQLLLRRCWVSTEEGMPDSRSFGARASSEPPPGDPPTLAPRSEARPRTAGRRLQSQTPGCLGRYGPAVTPWWILNQTDVYAVLARPI